MRESGRWARRRLEGESGARCGATKDLRCGCSKGRGAAHVKSRADWEDSGETKKAKHLINSFILFPC